MCAPFESVSLRLPDDTSPGRILEGMTSVSEQDDYNCSTKRFYHYTHRVEPKSDWVHLPQARLSNIRAWFSESGLEEDSENGSPC